MNITFITEMTFSGKVDRTHPNMRTEFAWMCALQANHIPLHTILNTNSILTSDIYIVILPKKIEQYPNLEYLPNILNTKNKPWGIMQEGPHWYFQDYSCENQIHYANILQATNFILTHNISDIQYFGGLYPNKPIINLPSLLIEDGIYNKNIKKDKAIIGGNLCSWYGGFDSFIVANEFKTSIYVPSMGRKIQNEELIPELTHLPYMNWKDWMTELSSFKFGVHLMRTHAAGTFALNCSYFNIPCIGYHGLDTQTILHPHLSVEIGNLVDARKLANKLKNDKDFYTMCSEETRHIYNETYTESIWIKNFYNNIIPKIYN